MPRLFRHIPLHSRFRSVLGLVLLGLIVIGIHLSSGIHLLPSSANAAASLETALKKISAGDMLPGADRYGQPERDPAFIRVWRGDELAGYVFMNTDVASAAGYSGKPIHVLIGLSTEGVSSPGSCFIVIARHRGRRPCPMPGPGPASASDMFSTAHKSLFRTVQLDQRALASSSGHESRFDASGRHHHLLDPSTAKSAMGVKGLSVSTRDATTADALSTALVVMDPDRTQAIIYAVGDTTAWRTRAEGSRLILDS